MNFNLEVFLSVLAYCGMAVSINGVWWQSLLDMRRAFHNFIAADILLIGIQIYAGLHGIKGAWAQAILLVVFLFASIKGLLTLNKSKDILAPLAPNVKYLEPYRERKFRSQLASDMAEAREPV